MEMSIDKISGIIFKYTIHIWITSYFSSRRILYTKWWLKWRHSYLHLWQKRFHRTLMKRPSQKQKWNWSIHLAKSRVCITVYKITCWKRGLWSAKSRVPITVWKTWKGSRHYTPSWTVWRIYTSIKKAISTFYSSFLWVIL